LASAAVCLSEGFLLLCSPIQGRAESAPGPAVQYLDSEYLVQTWQTEQGLPDNFINGIAQTADGYLWVATFNGLARFNGIEFTRFDSANTPALPSSRITQLYPDRQARLWIMSEYGDLVQWAHGQFKSFGQDEGLPKQAAGIMWEDNEGGIWESSSYQATNYYFFADGRFVPARATNSVFDRFGRAPDNQG
jgi:ligand-binding sensor domain-containing protein